MPRPADAELAAIRRIEAILAALDPARRTRVMRFIAERLEGVPDGGRSGPPKTDAPERPRQTVAAVPP